jgi:nitronate monooxygenase
MGARADGRAAGGGSVEDVLTDLLGIDAPVLLGPFGGLSSVGLAAEVSNAGGLGGFGLYGYSGERIRATVAELKGATSRPFAVNLWVPTGDEIAPAELDLAPYLSALEPLFADAGLAVPEPPAAFLPPFEEQLEAVWDAAPAVLSLVFGVPPVGLVDEARRRGIRVVGTATTVAEAVALDEAGVDAVVASGAEAGGHRISFLAPAERSLVGTFSLVPQVVDAVRVPVVAAGGIADRRGVAAAFALGAAGVQVGSAFLRTRQSAATDAHRAALAAARDSDTVLTRAMSGRLARGIPNRAMREIETSGVIAPFPAQNWMTGVFRAAAARAGDGELLSLWGGQSAAIGDRTEAAAVFSELVAGLPR